MGSRGEGIGVGGGRGEERREEKRRGEERREEGGGRGRKVRGRGIEMVGKMEKEEKG